MSCVARLWHPTGWTVRGTDSTLDKQTVKSLTIAFRLNKDIQPSSIKAWTKRLGEIDWRTIGMKYSDKLLTPRDYMTHFKLILHRGLLTRAHNNQTDKFMCRCCGNAEEKIDRLARCSNRKGIGDNLAELAGNAS